jgi:hypothetical protein
MTRRAAARRARPTHTASGRSVVRYRPNQLTEQQRVDRAVAIASHPMIQKILEASTPARGRPRTVSLVLIARLLFLHGVSSPQRMTIGGVETTLVSLTAESRQRLGVPEAWTTDDDERARLYRRLWSAFTALTDATRHGVHVEHDHDLRLNLDTGEVDPCPAECPAFDLTADEVVTTIVQASLPREFRRTKAIAVDGTDVESYAVPYSNGYRAPDGQVCADPEARWGKRTPTDRRPSEHYVGYELHLATYVAAVGVDEGPRVCAGMALRPGVQDRAGAAIALTSAIRQFGSIEEGLFDRGYTIAAAENFARPMRKLGVSVTMDLHTNQRGTHPGPTPGTLWIHGHLYSKAMPARLRDLKPPKIGDTADTKSHKRDVFDALDAYRYIAHSRHNDALGTQRFKGPALSGRLRCPNTPASMRLGTHLPTTTCRPDTDCGCGATVTVLDTEHERDRQQLRWQSNAWALSYNRRTYAETLNARVRFTDANLNRGFTQVLNQHSTAVLLAFYLASYNTVELFKWATSHHEPEPWAQQLGEPPDTRPLGRTTRSTRRHRRGPPGRHTTSGDN